MEGMPMGGGVTIIVIAPKGPKGMMPPGHDMMEDKEMGPPPMDLGPEMDMDAEKEMAPPKEMAPKPRPMANIRNMKSKREDARPRGLK